ncbi:MAG: NHL repeat-containing protein [Phormidesmis sp.]
MSFGKYKGNKKRLAFAAGLLGLLVVIGLSVARHNTESFYRSFSPSSSTFPTAEEQTVSAQLAYDPHFEIAPDLREHFVPLERGGLVSIAAINDQQVFVCNYGAIFLLTKTDDGYSFKAIDKPKSVGFWNPTGLFFVPTSQTLYVANYKGHNLLKFAYDSKRETITLSQNFTHPSLESPENVFVTESSEVLTADYDGDLLAKFAPDGTLVWGLEVAQAHGLAVIDDFIYVTSLIDRTVIKVNSNGEVVATAGGLGSEVGQYVWPVTITALKDGNMAVTDTQAGRITLLNPKLEVVGVMGANGPGIDLLNYPYATAQLKNGDMMIADTFKGRLLRLSEDWVIKEQILSQFSVAGTKLNPLLGGKNKPYTFPRAPAAEIFSLLGIHSNYNNPNPHGGFNSLDYPVNNRLTRELELDFPGTASYAMSDYYWYTLWAQTVDIAGWGNVALVASSQSPYTLIIDTVTGGWARGDIPLSAFPNEDGSIRAPDGRLLLPKDLLAPSMAKFRKLQRLLDEGKPRTQAFELAFKKDLPEFLRGANKDVWSAILTHTEPAKKFYNSYFASDFEGGSQTNKKQTDEKAAVYATEYFAETLSEPVSYLYEVLAINYLAGGSNFQLNQIDLAATTDTQLAFYEGYELEKALAADFDTTSYASAKEGQALYRFQLELPQATRGLAVRLDGLNDENYPSRYRVSFLNKRGSPIQTIEVTDNQQRVNVWAIASPKNIRSVDITLNSFVGEQRLLLGNIDLFAIGF